jgi:hypothetical protein
MRARVEDGSYEFYVMVGDAYLCRNSDDELVLQEPDLGMDLPLGFDSKLTAEWVAETFDLGAGYVKTELADTGVGRYVNNEVRPLKAEIADLRAELEEAREALRKIEGVTTSGFASDDVARMYVTACDDQLNELAAIARAALSPNPEGEQT